jgi:hypothetical protein
VDLALRTFLSSPGRNGLARLKQRELLQPQINQTSLPLVAAPSADSGSKIMRGGALAKAGGFSSELDQHLCGL